MKKRKIITIIILLAVVILGLFLIITGGKRTDVYLENFSVDGNTMTLNVGVSSSSGYIRKMKQTSGSMNYYFTFYSTFGINSKLGSKDAFTIELDNNVDAIYFYTGDKGYKQVLKKDENGNWSIITETINVEENITKIIENGPMTSSNPFDYIKASQDVYNELLEHPEETFKYAIKDLIDTDANNGLKSYIEAKLCSEINKNFQYNFESAKDFLEQYKEFLTKSYTNLNDYDKYAKELLK